MTGMHEEGCYQILIVDDEAILREGLRTILPWEKYGFSVCGTAANGQEGLQMIREMRPQAALVDIRMPLLDGLELCRYVREEDLGTKIILLTGYSEFEFARSALRYGVKDYLLKPVEEEELAAELVAIRDELQREQEREQLLAGGSGLFFDRLIGEILHSPAGAESIRRINRLFHVQFPWESYQAVLVEAHGGKEPLPRLREAVRDSGLGIAFSSEDAPGILVRDRVLEASGEGTEELRRLLEERLQASCRLILGSPCDAIRDIPLSYESAVNLKSMTFLTREMETVDSSVMSSYLTSNACRYRGNLVSDIVAGARAGDLALLRQLIGTIKFDLMEYDAPGPPARAIYANILVTVYNALGIGEGPASESLLFDIYRINREIARQTGIEQVERYTENQLAEWIARLPVRKSNPKIQPVLQYIDEHLDKDLRLELLARHFGYNSAYLGKMFREATGEYFNSYVDRLKMDRAKEYIRAGHLVYEAAQMVGYSNINYFYIKFKKYTGVAPGSIKKGLL